MSAAAAIARLHSRHGWLATIRHPKDGPVVQGAVLVAELPGSRNQRRFGQEDVRLADIAVLRSDLAETPDPPVDTVIEIATGPHAGKWIVLGPERTDAWSLVVRCRLTARANVASPGAREVVR